MAERIHDTLTICAIDPTTPLRWVNRRGVTDWWEHAGCSVTDEDNPLTESFPRFEIWVGEVFEAGERCQLCNQPLKPF